MDQLGNVLIISEKKKDIYLINPVWSKSQQILVTQYLHCQNSPLFLNICSHIVKLNAVERNLYTFMSRLYEKSYLENIYMWINSRQLSVTVTYSMQYKYTWNIKFLLRVTCFFKELFRGFAHLYVRYMTSEEEISKLMFLCRSSVGAHWITL